ncbi:MAG: hypothetical protein L0271_08475 [Gemmatimonadetes bacterium]|nr:hypothetical protein [Gemmatimonadota bacterium]
MPLTLDELKRRLTAASPGGVLRLGPGTLDSADLARLFRDFFAGGILELHIAARTDTVESVAFTGSVAWPAGATAVAHVTFTIGADGTAQAGLTLAPAASWKLRDPFPGVSGTPLEAVALTASTASMRSAGYAPADDPDDSLSAVSSLHLDGTLDLAAGVEAPLSRVAGLLATGESIHLTGTVQKKDGDTTVTLEADPFRMAAGSRFETNATLSLVAGPAPDGRVEGDIVLALHIGEGEMAVEVSGSLPVDSDKLFVTISPAKPLGSIQDVAALMPGPLQSILEKVPGPKLFEGSGLGLDHVIVILDLGTPAVDVIAAGIGGAQNWDLLGDRTLVISGVELTLLVSSPFSAPQPYAALTGTITFGGVPFEVTTTTEKTVVAQLVPGHQLDIGAFASTFLPAIPADLPAITMLEMRVGPGTTYTMAVGIAGPWHIPAGPAGLAIGPVFVHVKHEDSSASPPAGYIEGWAELFGVTLHLSDDLGGPLELGATLPPLAIGKVLAHFAPSFIPVPDAIAKLELRNAGIDFLKDGSAYRVDLATAVSTGHTDFGTVELVVQDIAGKWEAALGFQLPDDWQLSALSDALHAFDGMRLSGTGFVLSTFSGDPGFRRIHVPLEAGRVRPGIRLASTLSLAEGEVAGVSMAWVSRKLLGGRVDHATLAADLDAQLTAFDVAASIDGVFPLGNLPVMFRAITLMLGYQTPEIYVRLKGVFDVRAHEDTLHFTVSLTLDKNGGYGAATMEGKWHDAFGVKHFDLSNVALVAGIDVEGIPTLGIAGQIDVPGFDGSLALFFDSTSGSSVLAGSFSDITLGQISGLFLPPGTPASMPKPVADAGLSGVPIGTLPATVAAQLDAAVGDVEAGSELLSALRVCLPDLRGPCSVARPEPVPAPRTWYLTDRTLVRTWQIGESASGLAVSTETQLYLAGPGDVKIGELDMPAGFRLAGRLHIADVEFTIIVDGDPSPGGGFFAEANASSAIDWQGVLRIARGRYAAKTAGPAKGPFLSLATFDARSRGAQIAGPHFILSGQAELLGAAGGDVDFTANDQGFSGHVDGHVAGVGSVAADVRFASPTDFAAHGTVQVSVSASIPEVHVAGTTLVLVPAFRVDASMDADIGITMTAAAFTLTHGGRFAWQGRNLVVAQKSEAVTAADVQHLEQLAERFALRIVSEAGQIFHFLVADAESWVDGMKKYFAGKVANAEKILAKQFHKGANEIAGLLHTLGYGAIDVYSAIAAEFSPVMAVAALASPVGLGMPIVQIATLLAPLFPDPLTLGKLLYNALSPTWWQLYKALKAAFDLSWGELVRILSRIF